MNGKINYFVDGQVLKVRLEGNFTADELLELINRAFESPDMPEKVAVLIDACCSSVDIDQEDYQRIIDTFFSLADRIICFACITLSDKITDIIQQAAIYAEYNALGGVKPFPDKESAEKWIDEQRKN